MSEFSTTGDLERVEGVSSRTPAAVLCSLMLCDFVFTHLLRKRRLCALVLTSFNLALEMMRKGDTVHKLYSFSGSCAMALWSSLLLAAPLRALGVSASTISCIGFPTTKLLLASIVSRQAPGATWPGGKVAIKMFFNPPLLMLSRLVDEVLCPRFVPWPFFNDGHGVMVTDINVNLCMGGRPLAVHVPMLESHGVRLVVNMTEECIGPARAYEKAGIKEVRLPTTDTFPPSLEDLRLGCALVQEHWDAGGGRVYVHCKGGRGRASCMALCLLVGPCGMDPAAALRLLKAKRSVVEVRIANYPSVVAFCRESSARSVVADQEALRDAQDPHEKPSVSLVALETRDADGPVSGLETPAGERQVFAHTPLSSSEEAVSGSGFWLIDRDESQDVALVK